MELTLYQYDAFSDKAFGGNPAAVVPLAQWLDDALMQSIAMENNLSETAFLVPQDEGYALRWFTPTSEVDLCGHATLASGAVVMQELGDQREEIRFFTRSGELRVLRDDQGYALELPAQAAQACERPVLLDAAMGSAAVEVYGAADYLLVYECQGDIESLQPDFGLLKQLDRRGVMATAAGESVDFVLRFFAPKHGIDEDPVTGSAFCTLIPYWSKRLGKQTLSATQLSPRRGQVVCHDLGQVVRLQGQVAKYLQGTIIL